jgi:hypothetical protein
MEDKLGPKVDGLAPHKTVMESTQVDSRSEPESSSTKLAPADKATELGRKGGRRQICGADLSIPVFDGKSPNSADYFIDLYTPSMETVLDVRLYFLLAGDRLREDDEDDDPLAHTLEQAKVYDDEIVREGRLWLKACKDRGHG